MAFMLNFLVRLTGQLLRPNHDLSQSFKTIVICKFKGMGSIIQATPLIQTLRDNYPAARICFVTTPANVALLKKITIVDEIIVINDSNIFRLAGTTIRAIFRMWKLRIGVYFDLEIYSHFSSLVTTFSVARNRFGFYLRSGNYRMGMYTHMMYFNIRVPVSRVYLQMAALLPLRTINEESFALTGEPTDKIPEGSEYLVINPNASDLRLERRWPSEKFAELTRLLLQQTSFRIVYIGSRQEQEYVNSICQPFSDEKRIINIAGCTSLDELTGIIRNARAMITNDTGPMHIAFSTGCPVVALFGPCSPQQYGMSKKVVSIYKGHYCSPCIHEFIISPCAGNNVCMKDITVAEVSAALDRALQNDFEREKYQQDILYHSNTDKFLPGKVTRK
jgi:ADP-heptose:LPS heptosyltransferase